VHHAAAEARHLAAWSCSEQALVAELSARDPTGIGVEPHVLRLARRLLAWAPNERPSAAEALEQLNHVLALSDA